MSQRTIDQLTEKTHTSNEDVLIIVDSQAPSGTEESNKKVKISTISESISDSMALANASESWSSFASSEQNSFTSVAYGEGVLVAVSYDGTNRAMRSTDNGSTWDSVSTPSQGSYQGVTYCEDSTFVAVSNTGTNKVMRSTDLGLTWQDVNSPSKDWRDVTYYDGVIIVVSYGNTTIMRSLDKGLTWTSLETGSLYKRAVVGGEGVIVAVGDFGKFVYSTDLGLTFTEGDLPNSGTFRCIAYGGGVFVAISDNTTSRVSVSEDGINWIEYPSAEQNVFRGIAYLNGVFKVSSITGTDRIMSSSDLGKTWSIESTPESNLYSGIVATESYFVAVSSDGTNRVMTKRVNTGEKVIRDIDGGSDFEIDDTDPERLKIRLSKVSKTKYQVVTESLDVVNGKDYYVDTSGGAIILTVGDNVNEFTVTDYGNTFSVSDKVTIDTGSSTSDITNPASFRFVKVGGVLRAYVGSFSYAYTV